MAETFPKRKDIIRNGINRYTNMAENELIQMFGEQKVRTKWDEEKQKWYFSIVDVCGVLTDSKDYLTARKYWNKLKQSLKDEGNETVTNCHQLKLRAADGKKHLTICHRQTGYRSCLRKRTSDKNCRNKGRICSS